MSPSACFQSFRTLLVEPFSHDRPTNLRGHCYRAVTILKRTSLPRVTTENLLLFRHLRSNGRPNKHTPLECCCLVHWAWSAGSALRLSKPSPRSHMTRAQGSRSSLGRSHSVPFWQSCVAQNNMLVYLTMFNVTFKGQGKRWVMKWSVQMATRHE